MKMDGARTSMLAGFFAAAGMMCVAFFFQFYLELEPCPLCILQRIVVIALGLVCLVGFVHNPSVWGQRVYGVLLVLLSVAGLGVAARHVWLQHFPPPGFGECGGSLQFLLDTLPLNQVLAKVFHGSGDCAEVVFRLLGLSIPEWTLIGFVFWLLYSLDILRKG